MPLNPVIALAQIKYFTKGKSDNLEKIAKFIRLAKKAKADIVCFPESCIKKRGSLRLSDKAVKDIRSECKKNSIWCIITDDFRLDGAKYNMSAIIGRDGKIKGKYKKISLYGDNVCPGNHARVFETDFAKIGIAICWDITNPGLFTAMRNKGAEIVFCPSQWNYDFESHKSRHRHNETQILRALLLARAHEHVFYVALCNPLMDSKTQVSYSAIASPHKILKELAGKEGIITAEVNLKEIKRFRKFYSK